VVTDIDRKQLMEIAIRVDTSQQDEALLFRAARLLKEQEKRIEALEERASYVTNLHAKLSTAVKLLDRCWIQMNDVDRIDLNLERDIYNFLHSKERDTSFDTAVVWFDPDRGYIFRDTEPAPEEKS
jgi:hypothetical protein